MGKVQYSTPHKPIGTNMQNAQKAGPAITGRQVGGSIPLPKGGFTPAPHKAPTGVKAQVHAFVNAAWRGHVKAAGGLGAPCAYTGGLVCAYNVALVNALRQAWYPHLAKHGITKAAASQYTGYCTQSGAMHIIRIAQGKAAKPQAGSSKPAS